MTNTELRSSKNSTTPYSLLVSFFYSDTDFSNGRKRNDSNLTYLIFWYKGGSGGSASAKLQAQTNQEISAMQGQFSQNQQKAIDVLLSKCCEVSLEVPTARVRSTQKIYE